MSGAWASLFLFFIFRGVVPGIELGTRLEEDSGIGIDRGKLGHKINTIHLLHYIIEVH